MGYQPQGFSNSTQYTISADQISSGSISTTYYNPQTLSVVQYGWACPRCGKINAPWVNQCTCPGQSTTVWGSTTITNNPNLNVKSGNTTIDKDSFSTYTIHNGETKA